ncbi:MAG: BON domain-containing protein [Vicinamibacterales bacterium]
MLQKFGALVGAAALTVACAQTDAGITTNVKSKMAVDDAVKAHQIDIDTRNGVVTLSGDVDSALARERAVQIARTTDGVRDVVDNINVTASAPTGGLLERHDNRESIEDRVRQEGRELEDKAEREADRLGSVIADAFIADATITSAVKAKFLADTTISGLKIDVGTSKGVVTLTGTVSSRAEADRAVMMARNTEGVTRVIDHLRIGTN